MVAPVYPLCRLVDPDEGVRGQGQLRFVQRVQTGSVKNLSHFLSRVVPAPVGGGAWIGRAPALASRRTGYLSHPR